jgi:lysozyme
MSDAHTALRDQLTRHEGVRLKPYPDSVGKLTIGIGRNLDDRGISLYEAQQLLSHDIDDAERDLVTRFPWVGGLDPVRRSVLINMTFNMGITRLAKFVRTLALIERGDYGAAATAMLQSKWAGQVKGRAVELAAQMRTGQWA